MSLCSLSIDFCCICALYSLSLFSGVSRVKPLIFFYDYEASILEGVYVVQSIEIDVCVEAVSISID